MENSFIKRWEERPMGRLGEKRLFLLDMDGTIYLDEALFPGTLPFLKAVRARGGRYLFLTNNSSKSVDAYIAKLGRMGIEAGREDFLTSVDALIADLAGRPPYRLCYAFGTRSFQSQLQAAGIPVTDRLEDGVDCLLIGFDTELTFQKLEDACILLNRGWISSPPTRTGCARRGTARCPTAAACARCCTGPRAAGHGSSASPSPPWRGWPWPAPALPPGRR